MPNPPKPYDVLQYTIEELKRLLGNPRCSAEVIENKLHSIYFEEYFRNLAAKTIVVEPQYVDRDYLEDFAGYYVKCFVGYERWCTRLHFFDKAFTYAEFEGVLRGISGGPSVDDLNASYLGFIVVKPLPKTVVGRTCLRTYGSDGGRRHYPSGRPFKANLFGIPLSVTTLAFQEQDTEVAACATSALWAVFQGTGILFQHRIPTPVEITRAATEHESSDSRDFPASGGLNAAKMARAIRSVELEPYVVDGENSNVVKGTAYAYLSGGVPLVLGARLFKQEAPGQPLQSMGLHAVAVTGFSKGLRDPVPHGRTGLLLEATKIDELYAHDDQVGPFARMKFDGVIEEFDVSGNGNTLRLWSLHTSWPRDGVSLAELGARAVPTMLIVPLYHKIRIAYETIEDLVASVDAAFTLPARRVLGPARLVWDIRLTVGSDLKTRVIEEGLLVGERRERFLATPLPRFVWRATARFNGMAQTDLLFDATDIVQGKLLLDVLEYTPHIGLVSRHAASLPDVQDDVRGTPAQNVVDWLRANPSPFHLP